MKRNQFVIALACVLALSVIAPLWLRLHADNVRLEEQLVQARETATHSQLALVSSRETSALLEQKLGELAGVLSETTDKLQEASQRLVAVEAAKSSAAVAPAPVGTPPAIGAPARVPASPTQPITFARLLGADGRELVSDATFTGQTGRRLIFRLANSVPQAFDVDQLHPDILAQLGIDPDAARQQQYEIDQQKRAQAEAAQRAYQARLVASQKLAQQEAARQRDLARDNEERRKIEQERALKLEALDVERQKAQAALRQADAALRQADATIFQALNPVPLVVGQRLVGFSTNALPVAPTAPVQPTAPSAPVQPTGPPQSKPPNTKAPEPRRL